MLNNIPSRYTAIKSAATKPARPVFHAAQQTARAQPCPPRAMHELKIAGLLGSAHGLREEADIISRAIEGLVDDPKGYRLQRARAHAMGGDTSLAAEMLEEHYAADIQDDRALVTLGAALRIGGDPQWRNVLERVLAGM